MTISDQWASQREDDVGKAQKVKDLILSDHLWDVNYIIEFTTSIYDMLREADTDRPCLHLVYEMWDSKSEKVIGMKAWKHMSVAHFSMWCMIYSFINGLKIIHHYIAWLIP